MTIESEIRAFRESASSVLRTVSDSTAALKSIAVTLTNLSGCTSERTAGTVQNSAEASTNMTVAAAVANTRIAANEVLAASESVEAAGVGLLRRIEDFIGRVAV